MKILVLNGSPKRDASDTMHITRAFLAGMQDAGPQDVHTVDIIDRHIEYCTGCFSCMHNGGTCIHRDDMGALLEEVRRLFWTAPFPCPPWRCGRRETGTSMWNRRISVTSGT